MGRFLLLCCAASVLIGCASTPGDEPLDQLSWQQRTVQLAQLDQWRIKGKIALRTAEQSESGSLIWQQHQHNTHITLSGPLGLGATIIESDGKELRLSREGSTRRYDISSDLAAMANTGWDLPLSSLSYWIKGMPAPHSAVELQVVERGLWRKMVQDGWTVTYERYASYEGHTLPSRLTVVRGDTRARLILSQWTGLGSS